MSYTFPDGSEHHILVVFASRVLIPSKSNYAQIEKEALDLVFGVQHFRHHKPVMTILGPKQGIPSLAAARLQCWAILLTGYCYKIEFK